MVVRNDVEVAEEEVDRIFRAYPSAEVRDIVLSTGMVDGIEASYARLETVLA